MVVCTSLDMGIGYTINMFYTMCDMYVGCMFIYGYWGNLITT